MKKLIFFTLSLALSFGTIAQNRKEVSQILEEYEQLMIDRQWARTLDYTYPALFEVAPREMLEKFITDSFNDTSLVKISFKSLDLLEVSEVYKEEELRYSFADYSMIMVTTLVSDKTENELKDLKNNLVMQHGEENIKIEGKTFTITTKNKMAVIRKQDDKQLYLLEIRPDLEFMKSFMSEEFVQRAFEL